MNQEALKAIKQRWAPVRNAPLYLMSQVGDNTQLGRVGCCGITGLITQWSGVGWMNPATWEAYREAAPDVNVLIGEVERLQAGLKWVGEDGCTCGAPDPAKGQRKSKDVPLCPACRSLNVFAGVEPPRGFYVGPPVGLRYTIEDARDFEPDEVDIE